MDGLIATLLAGLLGIFGFGMDDNDPAPAPTVCAPGDDPCGVHLPPPAR